MDAAFGMSVRDKGSSKELQLSRKKRLLSTFRQALPLGSHLGDSPKQLFWLKRTGPLSK